MSDIDDAIAAAMRPKPPELQVIQISSTGRHFGLPPNMTLAEAQEVGLFLLIGIGKVMAQQEAAEPGKVLVTPQGPVKLRLA